MGDVAYDFAGRTAIVTGAGQGIGAVYARAFAAAGANTVVADLNEANAEAVARSIEEDGGTALAVAVDVADEAEVGAMVARTLDAFGGITVLVNNAGLFTQLSRGRFDTLPVEEWRRVLDVNVTGSYLCSRAVLPAMEQAGFGRIVMISSGTILAGRPNFAHYTTSKMAVVSLARTLGRELGGTGITVNAVLPGLTYTGIEAAGIDDAVYDYIVGRQSIPRREVPEDLVPAVMFLASEGSGFITGQAILVDGGMGHSGV